MIRWVFVVMLAASCRPSVAASPPDLEPARVERSTLAEADRLFARAYDEDDPTRETYGSPTFRRAYAAYRQACRDGHARGCWRAMYFKFDLEGYEMNRLRSLCRRRELMACRVMQQYEELAPDDFGYFGSSAACGPSNEEDCNEGALAAECDEGFPQSCEKSRDPQLQEHGRKLAAQGCRQGLLAECPITTTWEELNWKCWISPVMCFRRSPKVGHDYPHELARRDLAERACRLLGRDACIYLAAQYAVRHLPQPLPGRARALADRFCTRSEIEDPSNFCRELSGDTQQRLADLP